MIEPDHPRLSIRRQCELIDLPRASYYREPARETDKNLELMRLIDEEYTEHPFFGSRQMRNYLRRQGYKVNRKRVQRLMRLMGIRAIYRKPRTSKPGKGHKIYPYLLRGLKVTRLNQVWSADITFIPMAKGFLYLVAIIDWYSRHVLSWRLSNTLDADFCVEALEEALRKGRPEIFNTDQGSQFTGAEFTGMLKKHNIRISMDGKGSYSDNLFIERLWRTVKYEEVYLNAYQDGREARISLSNYFLFYNTERPHQALGYRTPAEVFAPIPIPLSTNGRDMVESFVSEPLVTPGLHLNSPPLLS